MQIANSRWWIFSVIFLVLCRVVEGDEEKIKRAIYNYQKGPKEPTGGKSDEDYFKNFNGFSPFEQVLAALGLSGDDRSKIHTSVEYWPPDMDREKFYQMVKESGFKTWIEEPKEVKKLKGDSPFKFWNEEPKEEKKLKGDSPFKSWNENYQAPAPETDNFKPNPLPIPIKPIFETIEDDTPQVVPSKVKVPENHYQQNSEQLSPNYNPINFDHGVNSDESEKYVFDVPRDLNPNHFPQVFEEISDYPEYSYEVTSKAPKIKDYSYVEETSKAPKIKVQQYSFVETTSNTPKIVKNFKVPVYPTYIEETPKVNQYKIPDHSHIEETSKVPKIKEFKPVKYPSYVEETSKAPKFKEYRTPAIKKETPKMRAPKLKEVPKQPQETLKFHYILQTPEKVSKAPKVHDEVTKKAPRIYEVINHPTTTTHKPKNTYVKPKFAIHASKIPTQSELPSSSEDFHHDDISMTDGGPILFPEMTTSRNKVRTSQSSLENNREHVHEVANASQLPPRANKKRKLKKKVKTSSIAQEVVDIGYRGSSGTLQQAPPQPIDVITTPQTSLTASTAITDDIVLISGGSTTTHLSDGYADPKYSDMIDNLSNLTELSFKDKKVTEKISSTTDYSPITETFNLKQNHGNSSIVADENMIAVLNLMRNASTTISSSSMEELKKAVIDNDLPKVKKIVRQHVKVHIVSEEESVYSTTEKMPVTRAKLSRSRFGLKSKSLPSSSSTESTISTKSFKRPVTTVKSTTARSSRYRTRPSTAPKSTTTTSRSSTIKSIVRRVTTRKSIKTTTSAQ